MPSKRGWGLLLLMLAGSAQAQMQPGPWDFPQQPPSAPRLRVVAVGDVLLHSPLHRQALSHPQGHQSLWLQVAPYVKQADMAYANLEGPIAPGVAGGGRKIKDPGRVFDGRVYTSYPLFNYHAHLAQDLLDTGFDVVSTANNHALDRGRVGVDATVEQLEHAGLPYTGTRLSGAKDPATVPWQTIVQRNGFSIAWLACSYGTNGIPDPDHQVLNCFSDRKVIMTLISKLAQHRGVDAVILTPHMGNEYELSPRANEIGFAKEAIEAGAIAVLGSHPHVLQPWQLHTNPQGRTGLIAYSMGNFVSGQFHRLHTRASVLLELTLVRRDDGSVVLEGANYLPLEMVRSANGYEVRPFSGEGTVLWNHIHKQFSSPLGDSKSQNP